ncbi:hypothetical protein ACFV80_18505 [Streptomyces sp. NPDC059862]|uniref:hypothetical protein n=1 Tax=Streptomyces sp. NPDC059862 TaxID=3346975 RepID=UPI0036541FEE
MGGQPQLNAPEVLDPSTTSAPPSAVRYAGVLGAVGLILVAGTWTVLSRSEPSRAPGARRRRIGSRARSRLPRRLLYRQGSRGPGVLQRGEQGDQVEILGRQLQPLLFLYVA